MTTGILGQDKRVYVYEERFWTGRRRLYIDGQEAYASGKRTFIDGDGRELTVEGNILLGFRLVFPDGTDEILCTNKWYEWLLVFSPFLVSLFAFFYIPVLMHNYGGFGILFGILIPVLLGILGAFFNLMLVRLDLSLPRKCLLCFVTCCVLFLLWFLIYGNMILGGYSAVFDSLKRAYKR